MEWIDNPASALAQVPSTKVKSGQNPRKVDLNKIKKHGRPLYMKVLPVLRGVVLYGDNLGAFASRTLSRLDCAQQRLLEATSFLSGGNLVRVKRMRMRGVIKPGGLSWPSMFFLASQITILPIELQKAMTVVCSITKITFAFYCFKTFADLDNDSEDKRRDNENEEDGNKDDSGRK
ncbi:hypothetical protein BGZ95_001308, partial [Linnemannia exigua]